VVLTVRNRIHLADILRRARGLKQVRRIQRIKNQ
jgi:guanosine-3',5'-bis(diphosphate) 3'-pyrophosphohydrolase